MKLFVPLLALGAAAAQEHTWLGHLWKTLWWPQPFRTQQAEQLFNDTASEVESQLHQAALKTGPLKDSIKDSLLRASDSIQQKAGDAKQALEGSVDSAAQAAKDSYRAMQGGLWEPLRRFLDNDGREGKLKEALSLVSVSSVRAFPDAYFLFVDVPGIPMAQLRVRIDGAKGRVLVQGSHEACATAEKHPNGKVCVERAIDRAFPLPDDVDSERVECVWRDGVVMLRLPRIASRGHEVPVKEASSSWLF